jgi:hypothetical protein
VDQYAGALPGQWGADPFDCGPYNRIQAYLGLIRRDALRVGHRALLAGLVAWVPLVVLTAAQGLLVRSDPRESFLLDLSAHTRYLVALPLLIIAEAVAVRGLSSIALHFWKAGLIPKANRPGYEALLASTRSLLASTPVELAILLLAYGLTLVLGPVLYPRTASTWLAPSELGLHRMSLAGWWRVLVSQPLFLVALLAWVWRLILWARFLRGTAKLDLRIVPAHPDLAGGLGFTGTSIRCFLLLAFALSVPVAGPVAWSMLYGGGRLTDFKFAIGSMMVILILMLVGPLLLLGPSLLRARTRGIFEYGALAESLGRRFEQRWIRSGTEVDPEALAAPDFSATTDLYSIAANVHAMRLVPVELKQIIPLIGVILLPFVPVVLIVLPLDEMVKLAAKLLL